jgi:class 3 adenylate cyclase
VVVDETRVRMTERLLARYVSPFLLEQLMGSPDDAASGRRQPAAVVTCRLPGFALAMAGLTPGRVAELLNPWLGAVSSAAQARGGLLVRITGDECVAVFGPPLATPDFVPRACLFARETMLAHQSVCDGWSKSSLPGLACAIGVAEGPCWAGSVGNEHRSEYVVLGEAVERSRLLAVQAAESRVHVASGVFEALQSLERASKEPKVPKMVFRRRLTPTPGMQGEPVDTFHLDWR